MHSFNGSDLDGRSLNVNKAVPKRIAVSAVVAAAVVVVAAAVVGGGQRNSNRW